MWRLRLGAQCPGLPRTCPLQLVNVSKLGLLEKPGPPTTLQLKSLQLLASQMSPPQRGPPRFPPMPALGWQCSHECWLPSTGTGTPWKQGVHCLIQSHHSPGGTPHSLFHRTQHEDTSQALSHTTWSQWETGTMSGQEPCQSCLQDRARTPSFLISAPSAGSRCRRHG